MNQQEKSELFRIEADLPHEYTPYPQDTAMIMPCMNCARPLRAVVHSGDLIDEREDGS